MRSQSLTAKGDAWPLHRAGASRHKAERQPYFKSGERMVDEVVKSIGIKLNTSVEQDNELKQLFEAFRLGINWSLKEIEKRYQAFLKNYKDIPKDQQIEGVCPACNKEARLSYTDSAGRKVCMSCARREYSEYTVRKEIYGVGDRQVEADLKSVTEIPNKIHYTMMFSQAYSMWNSYNAWRNKRIREKEMLLNTLDEYEKSSDRIYLEAARLVEKNAQSIIAANKTLSWKHAKAQAFKAVYSVYPDEKRKKIEQMHDKLMELRRLSKPIHFPELDECRTVMMSSGFVNWDQGKLHLTLFHKGAKEIDYFGKEYLAQYIPKMEEDNEAYCNLTKKNGSYYLMYPLTIKVRQPPDIKECDTFVFMTSPTRDAIIGYDHDGMMQSVKWFPTGLLAFAKRHFKEKRTEIGSRHDIRDARRCGLPAEARVNHREKMRKIRRRKKKLQRMGSVEARTVSSFNHQLTSEMIDYTMSQSENPKILIWDIGNGITQNFGRSLNYLKSLWPAVQQQDYLRHKAMQMSIPLVDVKYNKCNDMVCSSCEAKQVNENGSSETGKKKPMKVITQMIKGIKNFKCQKCGYEVNMLINQANNISNNQ